MTRFDRRALAGVALTAVVLNACSDRPTAPLSSVPSSPSLAVADDDAVGVSQYFAETNRKALAAGARVAITRAELLLTSNAPVKTPRIILATDRQLRLETRWVPRDLRRLSTDATLSYGVFSPLAKATVGGSAEAALDATFATWNAASCSSLVIKKKAISQAQLPSFILTGNFPPADIVDVGFLPGALFDLAFGAGSSQTTIATTVTFSFIVVGPNGQPILDANGNAIGSDIDGDGRFDTAFKEVWFNDALSYSTNGAPGMIDIESAALHEHGHALELGHFGRLSFDPKIGKLQASPRAVMNAANLGRLRTLQGTDNAALCGNFAGWR